MEATGFCLLIVRKYQFIGKDSEIKPYTLCLRNISKKFAVINIKVGLILEQLFLLEYY